jgi:WD40 repeat protein
MKAKRIENVVLLVLLLMTACNGGQSVETTLPEQPLPSDQESLAVVSEIVDEDTSELDQDLRSAAGSQTVINRQNAGELVQIEYMGKGNINNMAWSPLGSPIALATSTGIYLIDTKTYEEEHFSQTASYHVAFSDDGALLASAEGLRVILRDAQNGTERLVLEGHAYPVYHIAFSPIENLIATASGDGTVKLWDLASGDVLATLEKSGTSLYSLAFTQDGQILGSNAYSQNLDKSEVILWDVDSGTEITTASKITGATLAVSPFEKMIAAVGYDGPLRLFNYDGQVLITLDEEPKSVRDLAFSPDGKVLASTTVDVDQSQEWMNTTVRLWDTTSGELLYTLDDEGGYYRISFSPDGSQIATAALDRVKLWDVESGQEIADITDQANDREKGGYGTGGAQDFAWSPDGRTLALATERGVNLVNLQTGAEIELSTDGNQSQRGHIITFSPYGDLLAIASHKFGQGVVKVYDIDSYELLYSLEEFEDNMAFGIAFSPDGATLATGWGNAWGFAPGGVKIWDVSTGALIDEFSYERLATIYNLAFNHEGNHLATISGEGIVDIWDMTTGREVQHFEGTSGYGYAIAFSPDGKILAVGGAATFDDATASLRLIDLTTEKILFDLQGHSNGYVGSIAFNSDGNVLASASWDGTVRLWDVETGQQLAKLDVPGATSVAFSPDGTLLATAGNEDVLRLWGTPETAASFPENLAGEDSSAIPPLALGEEFRPGRWSPDGRYYFYSQQGPMDEPGPDQAYHTLTFFDTYTGESCLSVSEIVHFSYNAWVESLIPDDTLFIKDRTLWMNDNRVLYLSQDGDLLAITPCSDLTENWTDALPEPLTGFYYDAKYDHSQFLVHGETSAWLFTPSTGQFVKIGIPASNAYGETWFSWSPWEDKLISSRLEDREDWFGIIVEDIDVTNGTASLIFELPIDKAILLQENQCIGVGWLAKDRLSLGYWLNDHMKDYVIDLRDQPYSMTEVYPDLFGREGFSTRNLSHWGWIGEMGGDAYYYVLCQGLSPAGQCHLYSAETELVESYSFDPPKLLVFPNWDIAIADSFGETPMGEDPYQVIHIGTDREPYELEIRGRIPGQSPYAKVVRTPGRGQLLIATDQGITLIDLESSEILKFWVLENQAQYDDFSLHPSPDGKTVMVFALQNEENNQWADHTRAIYWLHLDG